MDNLDFEEISDEELEEESKTGIIGNRHSVKKTHFISLSEHRKNTSILKNFSLNFISFILCN